MILELVQNNKKLKSQLPAVQNRAFRRVQLKLDGRGRPSTITKDVIAKLEDGFMNDFTDAEACLYAGISTDALYRYERENLEFRKRKEALRLSPNLSAKAELVKGIKGDITQARWWATNKLSKEYGPKTTVEHIGTIEHTMDPDMAKLNEDYNKKHEEIMRNKIQEKAINQPS